MLEIHIEQYRNYDCVCIFFILFIVVVGVRHTFEMRKLLCHWFLLECSHLSPNRKCRIFQCFTKLSWINTLRNMSWDWLGFWEYWTAPPFYSFGEDLYGILALFNPFYVWIEYVYNNSIIPNLSHFRGNLVLSSWEMFQTSCVMIFTLSRYWM